MAEPLNPYSPPGHDAARLDRLAVLQALPGREIARLFKQSKLLAAADAWMAVLLLGQLVMLVLPWVDNTNPFIHAVVDFLRQSPALQASILLLFAVTTLCALLRPAGGRIPGHILCAFMTAFIVHWLATGGRELPRVAIITAIVLISWWAYLRADRRLYGRLRIRHWELLSERDRRKAAGDRS
jgi:hypothetical protein